MSLHSTTRLGTFFAGLAALAILAQLALATDVAAQERQSAVQRPESPLLQRGGVDRVHKPGRFSLSLGLGAMGATSSPDRLTFAFTPRYELRRFRNARLSLGLSFVWVPDSQPSPRGTCLDPLRSGALGHDGEAYRQLAESEFETGDSYILVPTLEWSFRSQCCTLPSFFLGLGLQHDRGSSGPLAIAGPGAPIELGDLDTESTTSPLLTFGFALERPLKRRLAMRLEARAMFTSYDRTTISLTGSEIGHLSDDMLGSALVTFGFRWAP